MKIRTAAVIIFAVIMLSVGIFEIIYVEKTLIDFEEQLEEIINGEEPFSLQKIDETKAWLHKKGKMLVFFVPHVYITEINATYEEMYGAVLDGDSSAASALGYRVKELSHGLRMMFEFNIQNIL